jgi:hypothetical protein
MQKKFYQTAEFKRLSKIWEKRLEQEGLKDVEVSVGTEKVLKQNSPNTYRQMDAVRREAKETYFRRLGICLHDADFSGIDGSDDLIVMIFRAHGLKIVEICSYLTKIGMSRYRRTVRLIIRRYEHKWGIRNWKPEQLTYRWKPKT